MSGRRFGVRRPGAALFSKKLDRYQSGARPPHSKAAPIPVQYSLFILVLFLFLVACKSQSEPAGNNASHQTVVASTPPFQTKEPDRYRATRTITIVSADGKTVITKTSIGRDGDMRRNETETTSKKVAYLDLPEGKFVLLPDEKVYSDLTNDVDPSINEDEEITPERLLHDDAGTTSYQNVGTEVIGGRNSNKYRIVVNSSSAGNVTLSETLMWIDEALNMPVKSETTSPDGTRITMELSDIVFDVDKRIFQVPDDYEKIAFSELRKRLTAEEVKR